MINLFLLFTLLFLISVILFFVSSRIIKKTWTVFSKIKTPLRLGITFCIAHLCLAISLSILFIVIAFPVISKPGTRLITDLDPESIPLIFINLIFYCIDLPSSLLVITFSKLFMREIKPWWIDFFVHYGLLTILGSLQYFLIGIGVGWLYKKITKK